jgi:hypothetical protein
LCWKKTTTKKNADDAYPLPSVDGKTMIQEEEEEVDQMNWWLGRKEEYKRI